MFAWLRKKPDLERMIGAAIEHHEAGRLDAARAAYREVLRHDAGNVDCLHFLGFIAYQQMRHDEAIELISRALALNPANARAQQNLGNAYQALGRHGEAAARFERAIALAPELLEAHYNLGIARRELGQRDAAADCFREVLRLNPDSADAHYCLGHLHADEDRVAAAATSFRSALALRPDFAEARWSLALGGIPQVYSAGEDPAEARAAFSASLGELERWSEGARGAAAAAAVGAMQPFSLAYDEAPNRELLERYGRLCARLMGEWRAAQGLPEAPSRRAGGRMRVGVVAAQFHDHSVWHALIKGWFRELDGARFELHAFHIGSRSDRETSCARAAAESFVHGARPLRGWVDAILATQPDALIYPEIGMDPTALRLASLRLAPLQLAAWGHPETTGLPTVDGFLSAEDFEPAGAQANYAERLIPLPHLGCSLEPRRSSAPAVDSGALGFERDGPMLVCPGVPFKYAPRHDWIFPELAQRLGRCRFLFFTHSNARLSQRLHERLRAAFAARGLDSDRHITFLPWLSKAAFQGLMSGADAYLDTIGFSGFNTALQAAECGLPVVTREGRFMRGRLASGILKRLGLAELVAPSEQGYVELAERIVRDRAYRAHVAARMTEGLPALFADRAPIAALERTLAGQDPRAT
jgi:predicted O-linked N-acetylglucosamine transferase (SPINDLY family)